MSTGGPISLKQISRAIYPVCYFVEEEIAGQADATLCDWWAKKNAFRHSLSLRSILAYLDGGKPRSKLTILNLSGLYPGHQDFSICDFLRREVALEYYAVDHPNSPFLSTPSFVNKANELGIRSLYKDIKDLTAQDIGSELRGSPDIILFTEIAEHLEHGSFLRCLRLIAELLPSQGLLLLSTPNADAFKYRIAHLLGRELSYWGDGTQNMEKGLFGHIVYYNIPRLRRLLRDVGLEIRRSETANFPVVDAGARGARRRVEEIKLAMVNSMISAGERCWRVPILMNALRTMGELIFLEIEKGAEEKVPFAL